LATIAGIDPTLSEAATIDGSNRFHKIRYIVWPGLRSVVVIMLILRIGHVMDAGFMQVINLYNPAVYEVGDILDTYIFRSVFSKMSNFGISTAIGVFVGVINCVFLVSANKISKWLGETGIF
jgi:putative aldouronate transport system permease protein